MAAAAKASLPASRLPSSPPFATRAAPVEHLLPAGRHCIAICSGQCQRCYARSRSDPGANTGQSDNGLKLTDLAHSSLAPSSLCTRLNYLSSPTPAPDGLLLPMIGSSSSSAARNEAASEASSDIQKWRLHADENDAADKVERIMENVSKKK